MDSKLVQLEHVSADSVPTAVRQPMKAEESVGDSKFIKLEPADEYSNVEAAPMRFIDNRPAHKHQVGPHLCTASSCSHSERCS